jgi:glycosyltransferase involved in cell wall biosynthesis
METRISVVVPARNEAGLLPNCLSALQRQNANEFEIMVVDSASTDRTKEVAESFGARVIRLDEPGVARARQAGFEAARGDVIVSTDADAVCKPDWLQRITAPFIDPSVVAAFGTIELEGSSIWAHLGHSFFSSFQAANMRLGHPLFCGPNFAVTKQAFTDVGGFRINGKYPDEAEDVLFAHKIKQCGRIIFLPDSKVTVSSRRLKNGQGLRYTTHHLGVYVRVCWFAKAKEKL